MDSPVGVIGGGGSGLVTAAALRRAGVPFELLEARDGVGGTWRFDENGTGSACYASLVANTSKLRMMVGKQRIPGRPWQYARHDEMLAYLERFADAEGLRPTITCNWRVDGARREEGAWVLRSGAGEERRYRAVVCALGLNARPRFADVPGEFSGQQLHSAEYRRPEPFAGRDVLVIGLGTSGAEVVGELAGTARSVQVAVRSPLWMMTRRVGRFPIDWSDDPWLSQFVPWSLRRQVIKAFCTVTTGRLRRHGLPWPTRRIGDDIIAISDAFPRAVRAGAVQFRPAVARVDGHQVTFADGTTSEVDTIVHATGYGPPTDFLPEEARPTELALYRGVVHPDVPDLYFVGLFEAHHALLAIAQEQAAWTADVLAGRVSLPPPEARRGAVALAAERRRRDFGDRRPFFLEHATYRASLRRDRRAAAAA